MAGPVERAQDVSDGQAWAVVYEVLADADRQAPLDADGLERLAVAAYLVGKDEESAAAWERAHLECMRSAEPAKAARCAFWLGLALLLRGESARADGWLARAGRLVEDGGLDCVARGYLLVPGALGALEQGDAALACSLSGEAAAIAYRFDDRDLLAFAWLGQAQALLALGDRHRGLTLLDEVMVAITTHEVSPVPAGIVYCAVIEACMDVFDLRRAAEWTEALRHWCDAQPGLVPYRGQCLVHRSQVLQAHGRWSEAASEAERARMHLSRPEHPALGVAFYQLGELHRLRGDFPEAERAYRQASRYGREPAPGFALLRLAEGRVDSAVASIQRMVDEARGLLARPAVLGAAVDVMLAAGDLESARVASAELSAIADNVDAPLLDALAAHARGSLLLAEHDAATALASLRSACRGWRELEMPYEIARVRVLIAGACRALGDHDAADAELDAARVAFADLGAQPDLVRVLQLGGVPSPGETSLTMREREVLRLVAAGKTNRQIGGELSISEHTVARHVQNTFTKLGLSSRVAATAYAYEHGLV